MLVLPRPSCRRRVHPRGDDNDERDDPCQDRETNQAPDPPAAPLMSRDQLVGTLVRRKFASHRPPFLGLAGADLLGMKASAVLSSSSGQGKRSVAGVVVGIMAMLSTRPTDTLAPEYARDGG